MGTPRIAIALLLALGWPAAARCAPPAASPSLRETLNGGLYRVEARFVVRAPAATVWSVLTDYEGMPGFLASVRRSVIAERDPARPTRIVLEQRLTARVLLVPHVVRLRLEVEETPTSRIDFRDLSLVDFAAYAGSWTLDSVGADETEVTYRLDATPRRATPSFVVGPAVRDGAAGLIDEIRAEIARRVPRSAGEQPTAQEPSHEPIH